MTKAGVCILFLILCLKVYSNLESRKPDNAAAVRFCLKFANIFCYKFKSIAKLRKQAQNSNILEQNKQNEDSESFKAMQRNWKGDNN